MSDTPASSEPLSFADALSQAIGQPVQAPSAAPPPPDPDSFAAALARATGVQPPPPQESFAQALAAATGKTPPEESFDPSKYISPGGEPAGPNAPADMYVSAATGAARGL